jgi:processive 1,2-diacylglycerol beta-glucosyltransferase
MPKKKILVLSVSAGAGHTRAADAIVSHAGIVCPDVEILHLDVMDYVPAPFRKIYVDFYIALVSRHPALWGHVYQMSNSAMPTDTLEKIRRIVERLNTRALRKKIMSFKPDAIICTHFLPAEILDNLIRRNKIAIPVWVQVTDFDLHRLWVHPHMTGYFAASGEVAFCMREKGILREAVHVTGIPVMPAFETIMDRTECARMIGIEAGRTTIMMMNGGAGVGDLPKVAAALLELDSAFQLIVLAGKNQPSMLALQRLALLYPGRLLVQGYTNRIELFMACADIVITKAGGLTVSECLAFGLPMIVNNPIPGQEERNADFLLEQGAALKAVDEVSLIFRVRYLLENPEKLNEMRRRSKALGRPEAGRLVLEKVLQEACA